MPGKASTSEPAVAEREGAARTEWHAQRRPRKAGLTRPIGRPHHDRDVDDPSRTGRSRRRDETGVLEEGCW
jgi:hypothetical protein